MTTGREADEQLIRRLMDGQTNYDWAALRDILAEDAVFDMPFIGETFSGRDEIIARWRPSLERLDGVRFYDLDLRPMAEAGWYIGTFRNTCTVRTTGLIYDQMYISLFHVRDGRIAQFTEYFDTIRLGLALKRVARVA